MEDNVMQGARASTTIVLTYISKNIYVHSFIEAPEKQNISYFLILI